MKKYKYWLLIIGLLGIITVSCGDKEKTIFPVIPQPNSLTLQEGEFSFSDQIIVYTNLIDSQKTSSWFSDLPIHTIQDSQA